VNWQPIATAPKDGTKLLLWARASTGPREVLIGWWHQELDWFPCFEPTYWAAMPEGPNEAPAAP
jgi:hypothetical protein